MRENSFSLSVILLVYLCSSSYANNQPLRPLDSPYECGSVFLSISSLTQNDAGNPKEDDKLELNWNTRNCAQQSDVPDTISLFDEDPVTTKRAPLESVLVADNKWGFYVTQVSLGHVDLPGGWKKQSVKSVKNSTLPTGSKCFPFWIASFHNNTLLRSNCFKIQPTWMADIRNQISHVPVSQLILPGTHNAGSYSFDSDSESRGGSGTRGFYRSALQRYVLCQDRDIWTQLAFGIRYLDFRIAYYKGIGSTNRKFWVNHNLIQVTRLLPTLKDIRKFMESTTDEIVIMDIHQLPVGFYESNKIIFERHEELLTLLNEELGDHISNFQRTFFDSKEITGPTVSEILKSGKRLIIGYPERSFTNAYKWLWPSVKHMWGNTNNPHQLRNYLDSVMSDPYRPDAPGSNPLWSAMAQTTPSTLDVILGKGSLRKNADAINRNLTSWLQFDWTHQANIISSDFFLGNNLIDLSIHLNELKGKISLQGKVVLSP